MSLQQRLAERAGRLTPADRSLLDVVLNHPTEAAFLTATEVAGRAGVHQATATKLAQKLGYRGYPGLRQALQVDLLDGPTPAERVRRRLDAAEGSEVVAALVEDEVAALGEVVRHVPQSRVDAAARLLLGAGHVLLLGRGNATVLVDLLHRRLRRYGIRSTPLPAAGRDLAEQLVGVRDGDLLVVVAFRRLPRHLDVVLERARERGAAVLVVTDVLGPQLEAWLEGTAAVVLAAPRGSGREFQSLTVPMAVVNALVLTLARLAPEQTLTALEDLRHLLGRLDR